MRADAHLQLGRTGYARRDAEAVLEKTPSHAPARLLLGRALHRDGDLAEAAAAFRTALASHHLSADRVPALREFAAILKKQGDALESAELLVQAARLGGIGLSVEAAKALEAAGEGERARRIYLRLLRVRPNHPDAVAGLRRTAAVPARR